MKLQVWKRIMISALLVLAALGVAACGNQVSEVGDQDIIDFEATPAPTTAIVDTPTTPTPDNNAEATPTPDVVVTSTPNTDPTPTPKYTEADLTGETKETPPPKTTYEEAKSTNSDVIGWIKIKDTNVDYPLVQGTDNQYYLTHNAEKEDSQYGAIFMDYRNSSSDKHIIIYGHNMRNGSMFGAIHNYSLQKFYDAHRTITVKFGSEERTYKVFATYTIDAKKALYTQVKFENNATFAATINGWAKDNSRFPTDTKIKEGDEVITLSTCNRQDYADGREVVHAVRVK